MKKTLTIYLTNGYDLLIVDFIFRLLLLLFTKLYLTNPDKDFILWGLPFIHLVIFFVTIFYAKRRLKGIQSYLKTRLISHEVFNNKLKKKGFGEYKIIVKSSTKNHRIKSILISIFLSIVCFFPYFFIFPKDVKIPAVYFTLITLVFTLIIFLTLLKNFHIFIQRQISYIEEDKELLSDSRVKNIRNYLNQEFFIEEQSLSFWNDEFIVSMERDFNIYKEKLETFLLESIFLGALTFSTFIQLISNTEVQAEVHKLLSANKLNSLFLIKKLALDPNYGFTYLFIGSVLSSVLYITILIKRFPIIKSIETVRGHLKMAEFYNLKEEKAINLEVQSHFSSQIQVELAYCEEQKISLESNLKMITVLRNSGLFCFFFVVLVSAMMIHVYFFWSISIIIIYVLLASYFTQNDNFISKLVHNKTKKI